MSKSAQSVFVITLLSLLVFLSYRPALNAPFVFDDTPNIVENRRLHLDDFSPAKLTRLKQSIGNNRPLAMFSFALNYYFGRLDPFGYHLLNILIHLAAAVTLYFLVQVLLLDTPYQPQSFLIAATTSLLFVSHPVQTQSVTYIVQRMNSMAGLFFLLTLLAYLRGRLLAGKARYAWWSASGLAALCAFASKEISATLPLFIFLIEVYLKPEGRKKGSRHWLLWAGGLGVILLLVRTYTRFDISGILNDYQRYSFTMGQRLLTQPRVVVHYLSLLVWPLPGRLNLDYDFPTSLSLLNPPTTLFCLLFLLGLLGISLYLAKKEPLVAFCIWWFLGNLVIESSIIPLDMVFEHRLYLPSVGVFLLLSLLLAKAWQRFEWKEIMAAALILPVAGLLSWGTYRRNLVWADPVALWEDVVSKSPNKPRPHLSLGAAYADVKRYQEALAEYKLALQLRPDYAKAHYNLGLAMERQGKRQEAIKAYQKALKFKSNYGEAHNNLGGMYLQQGRYEEAEAEFLAALRLKPEFIEIRGNLATIYLKKGDLERAKQEYIALLKQKPNLGEIHYNLATLYLKQPYLDYSRARQHLAEALRLRPKRPPQATIRNLLKQVGQRAVDWVE